MNKENFEISRINVVSISLLTTESSELKSKFSTQIFNRKMTKTNKKLSTPNLKIHRLNFNLIHPMKILLNSLSANPKANHGMSITIEFG